MELWRNTRRGGAHFKANVRARHLREANVAVARVACLAAACASLALVGLAVAFITRSVQGPSHTFTFGDVTISIDATAPVSAERTLSDMLPNQPRDFDPTIAVGATSADAYLFAKVNMPQGDIDGSGPGGEVDLFETDMVTTGSAGHWRQVIATQANGADVTSEGVHSVVYAWVDASGNMLAVPANGTADVFTEVVYVHRASVQLSEQATISVDAYAVQASYLGANHAQVRTCTPEEVWALATDATHDQLPSS